MNTAGTISERQIVTVRGRVALMPSQTKYANSGNTQIGVWINICQANFMSPPAHSGTAFSPCVLDSFEANDATVMTTAISAITMVQMALISGFTPNRTSE